MTELQPRRFGRYLLIDRISVGGMAEVFLAKASGAQGFEKVLAIKRILPVVAEDADFQTMFVDEAQISARLNHANIGQIFEFGEIDGTYFLTMEFIAGQDLRALKKLMVERGEPMPPTMAMHIIGRVCQALDYAHRQKGPEGASLEIVHRDVSPPNVLLSYQGEVKLIDFGIARAASRATRTRAGKLKGKFAYMSPEQIDGRSIDHRSDIFSVGIVLYEMLTNRRPFEGATQLETLNQVRRTDPDPPSTINPEVPLELDRIVLKALAKDPAARYHWASELRADLERFFARTETVFESRHLSEWMHEAFADAIEDHRQRMLVVNRLKVDDFDAFEATPLHETSTLAARGAPSAEVPTNAIPLSIDEPQAADQPTSDMIPVASGEIGAGEDWGSPPEAVARRSADVDDDVLDDVGELTGESTMITGAPAEVETRQWATPPGGIDEDDGRELDTTPKHRVADDAAEPGDGGDAYRSGGDLTDEIPLSGGVDAQDGGAFGEVGANDLYEAEENDLYEAEEDPGMATRIDSAPRGIQDPPASMDSRPLGQPALPPPSLPPHALGVIDAGAAGGRIIGGALDVDSSPDVDAPPLGGPSDDRFGRTEPGPPPRSIGLLQRVRASAGHLQGVQLIALVSGATLLLVGMIVLLAMTCGGPDAGDGPTPPAHSTGSMVITTRPPADCVVSFRGLRPKLLSAGRSLSIRGAKAGRYRVKVNCAGFSLFRQTVVVRPRQVTFLEAKLERQ